MVYIFTAARFGAFMVILMKDVVKKLCVLEILCFAIHTILLQAASKVIINNCRDSKQGLFYLYYYSLCGLRGNTRAMDKTTKIKR